MRPRRHCQTGGRLCYSRRRVVRCQQRGSALDVGGAYNTTFLTIKRVGPRTSMIVDPPNGRMPPLTREAQQIAAAERAYRVALLRSTETCKNKEPGCAGGTYDPLPAPQWSQMPATVGG